MLRYYNQNKFTDYVALYDNILCFTLRERQSKKINIKKPFFSNVLYCC